MRLRRGWPPPRPAGFAYPSPGDVPGLVFGAVNGISAAQFGKINDSFTDSAMVSAMDGFGIGSYGLAPGAWRWAALGFVALALAAAALGGAAPGGASGAGG